MHPLVEEENDTMQEGGQDFTDAGPPETITESSMSVLRHPTVMVESYLGGDMQHTEVVAANDTSLGSDPELPLISSQANAMMSSTHGHRSTAHQIKTTGAKKVKNKQRDDSKNKVMAVQSPVLHYSALDENLPLSSSIDEVPPTSVMVTPPMEASYPFTWYSPTSTCSTTNSVTSSAHSITSHQVSIIAHTTSSTIASSVTTTTGSSLSSPVSATISPSATKGPSKSTTGHTATTKKSSHTKKSIPPSSSSATTHSPTFTSMSKPSTTPVPHTEPTSSVISTSISNDLPSTTVSSSAQKPEIQASSGIPVVSIRPTQDKSFSGSAGSVPTNSWNVVVPSNTDSLPRNALEEDDIEVIDFDVSESNL